MCRAGRRLGGTPGRRLTDDELLDRDVGSALAGIGPAAHVAGLERHQPPGSGLGHRTARQRRVEVRGHGRTEHVVAVGLVGHPQREPEVGVGPQVVLDHTGRALGGEHQVQAERAAPLCDVDHPVHELRHLVHQRRELVYHDHQARRGLRVAGPLQFLQVLDVLGGEQVLTIGQFRAE